MKASTVNIPIIAALIIATLLIQTSVDAVGMVYDRKWSSSICIKNYDAGGAILEDYSKLESLNSQISAISHTPSCGPASYLGADIDTYAIGQAHSAWISNLPVPDARGRHALVSQSSEDLTGVFTIVKTISIGPNNTTDISVLEWIPCV